MPNLLRSVLRFALIRTKVALNDLRNINLTFASDLASRFANANLVRPREAI